MRRGVRRPLIALVALVVALAVGYGIRAIDDDGGGGPGRSGTPTTSVPSSGPSGAERTSP